MFFKTNIRLMQVKSIAECSKTFDLHSATVCHLELCFDYFRVAVLHRFYCTIDSLIRTLEISEDPDDKTIFKLSEGSNTILF